MENRRHMIIILIILVLIIIIGLIYANISKKQEGAGSRNDDESVSSQGEHFIEFKGGSIEPAQENDYYTIDSYMTNFLNSLAFEDSNTAIQLIDKTYAQENNIDVSNITSKLKFSDKYQIYNAIDISYIDLDENKRVYIIEGEILEKESSSGEKKRIDAIINVDFSNVTFSIKPYQEGTLNKESLDTDKMLEEFKSIDKNENNRFVLAQINDKLKASKLFNKYISETLYYPNDAYEMLDEEYKNKRFGSIEKYKAYVTENQSFIKELVIDSYAVSKKEGYTEYRIMDNYGNMYTFNVTNLLNYTMKMDDYTIPTDEFIQQYNSAGVQEQVSLNIGKFFSMLNAKDYDSAYACLAEGFKQNYFPTVDDFKKYAEENFFKGNKLEGVSFENEGETYMLTIKVSDYRGRDTRVVEKTIIMQLNEGTDFVMSFNVE